MWNREFIRAGFVAVGVAALTLGPAALARNDLANGWSPTEPEILKVPDYCQVQFRSKNKSYGSPGCDGVHHFCVGLVLLDRASNYSIPKRERQRILKHAKNEVNYMATRMQPTCKRASDLHVAQMRIKMLDDILN